MSKTLKATWQKHRTILGNFFSLSVLQVATYLAPLITLPYLVRILGPSRFGLVELAHAIAVYLVILTDYGFNLSATREISLCRDDPRRLSEIFSAVMLLKLLLTVASLIALAAAVLAVPKLRGDWAVYLLAFGTVIGQCLFPIWLFQGLERMKYTAILTILSKLAITVSIFVFIRRSDDYIYVPVLQSIGTFAMGVAGLLVALREFPVHLVLPSRTLLRQELVEGWHLYVSKMSITLYTTSNTVILGLFTNNTFVAYYVAGEKIVRAIQGLQLPLSQAVYPYIGKLAAESKDAALAFAARMTEIVGIVTLALSVGLFLAAEPLGRLILGGQFDASVPVIRILSPLPFVCSLSNIFGVQIMINFGLKKTLTKILAIAGVVNVILVFILVAPLHHVGVSIAVLLTEASIAIATYVALRQNGLDVFRRHRNAEPYHGL